MKLITKTMKKNLLFVMMLAASQVFGQSILSLSVLPSIPTENDSVFLLAHCAFTSAPCNQHMDGYDMNGNVFNAWTLHCVGPLTVTCDYTDTFSLGVLPAGNYVFNFHLDQGFGEVTCTPGIVAGPDSSLSFTVSPSTSGDESTSSENIFSVYPNPASDYLKIKLNHLITYGSVSLYNIYGRKVIKENISDPAEILFDVKKYGHGIYFLQIITGKYNSIKKIIIQ
jgi:hypothetical protein